MRGRGGVEPYPPYTRRRKGPIVTRGVVILPYTAEFWMATYFDIDAEAPTMVDMLEHPERDREFGKPEMALPADIGVVTRFTPVDLRIPDVLLGHVTLVGSREPTLDAPVDWATSHTPEVALSVLLGRTADNLALENSTLRARVQRLEKVIRDAERVRRET